MKNDYDKTIGYAHLEHVDEKKTQRLIGITRKIIDGYYLPGELDIILVAGAGAGLEAVIINREFRLKTVGVDLNIDRKHLPPGSLGLMFQKQDLASLAFNKNTFSLVYCYHVLEHVADHMAVLNEIYRVMKPGGVLFIGFPNRNRLISYIGTSQKVSILDKIKWNINDCIYRLQGKFENKYGAHAGFTEKEFIEDASGVFETINQVRNKYMLIKYANIELLMRYIIKTKLEEFIFPSNYYICIKANHGHE